MGYITNKDFELLQDVQEVLDEAQLYTGPEAEELAERFADFISRVYEERISLKVQARESMRRFRKRKEAE